MQKYMFKKQYNCWNNYVSISEAPGNSIPQLKLLASYVAMLLSNVNFRNSSPFGSGLAKMGDCVNLVWLKIQLVISLFLVLSFPEGIINSLADSWVDWPTRVCLSFVGLFPHQFCTQELLSGPHWQWASEKIQSHSPFFFHGAEERKDHLESYFPFLFYR